MSTQLKTALINHLLRNSPQTRTQLLKKLWAHYENMNELDEVLSTFKEAEILKETDGGLIFISKMARDEFNRLFKKPTTE